MKKSRDSAVIAHVFALIIDCSLTSVMGGVKAGDSARLWSVCVIERLKQKKQLRNILDINL